MSRSVPGLLMMLAVMVPAGIMPAATEDVNALQARFDRETNSVHKAKLMEKLGDAQLEQTRRASQASDYKTIGFVMEKYRDNARAATDALKKDHPDAERHTNGFKQLQIHVHKALREVDEVLVVAPDEYRPPLEIVRRDLATIDDELLELLFPRHPTEKKARPEEFRRRAGSIAMKSSALFYLCLFAIAAGFLAGPTIAGQKDYLSSLESDKIRDAENSNERIKLFVTFADDRLKKFQYELQHPSSNKHPEMLNALMNAYVGCVDDAADLIQLGIQKQENIRPAIDLMAGKTKEFLQVLEKLSADGTEIDIYKDNLNDAIEGTRDAMNDAEKAKKAVAPPPVRRKN